MENKKKIQPSTAVSKVVSPNNYDRFAKDPFFLQKAHDMKALLDKVGLPEEIKLKK